MFVFNRGFGNKLIQSFKCCFNVRNKVEQGHEFINLK
mgnify:CR=1 FL=1